MRFENRLPTALTVDGAEYSIHWDFRTSLKFTEMLQEGGKDEEILLNALSLYYGENVPKNIPDAVDKIMWFYSSGDEQKGGASGNKRTYSFDEDWDYIYAAFLEQFRIDLEDADLHWWKFKAMFASISDKTRFGEIVGYRSIKLSNKMPKEQKEFYRKMQKLYGLRQKKTQEVNEIEEALLSGELDKLLN